MLGSREAFGQVDSLDLRRDTVKTPSPVGTNTFITDSIIPPTTDNYFVIRDITIEGNRKTRDIIILRELPFKSGDSILISQIPDLFSQGKTQLLNTSLFAVNEVNVHVKRFEGHYVDVGVKVKERWYLWPIPYVKPVDRNLNQWLFEKGADAKRLDYGVKLLYTNVSGNNDKLRFYFITGYTKQLRLSYSRPYIDKDLKWGINVDLSLGKNHEINYGTENDKQLFVKDNEKYLRNFFDGFVETTYRPAFFTRHIFGIGYSTLHIGDTVRKLNPEFLANGTDNVRFPRIYYRMIYQNLDYIPYPTKGYAAELYFGKIGFDRNMNLWQLHARGLGNWHLGRNTYYSLSALGTLKLPFDQPFINKQLLGYGDMFLRGYEYYVMDGVAGGLVNATLAHRLANFSLQLPFLKKYVSRNIPLKIYGKVFGNAGYSYDPDPEPSNRLNNRMVYGGGLGLDIFTEYDFTLKVELSFNQLGQNGVYLHKKNIF
ncbi:hypothetical protein GCM10027051_03720 [Niabella terrae]